MSSFHIEEFYLYVSRIIPVRASIFHLLGLFCELYPEHTVALSERLIGIFIRTLRAEVRMYVCTICLSTMCY